MKKFVAFLIAALCCVFARPAFAEWLSIDGQPAKWGDILEVRLGDIHPTQPCIGFDKIYYKLARYEEDHRKIFRDYCRHNGMLEVRDFSFDPAKSNLQDPKSFACLEAPGTERAELKTVVIAPDGNLYLTDGHHTFNLFWHMPGGGPNLHVYVVVDRDYRNFKTMDEFWKQMEAEKNIWLYDENEKPISTKDLPKSFGLENFHDDSYRSLLYFTRKIAWNSPGDITVPEPKTFDERYPAVPFTEFYWSREVRKTVDLAKYDLSSMNGYVAAIKAVGKAIMDLRSKDVGGSGQSSSELGQFQYFGNKELFRISRPGTGKLAYLIKFKSTQNLKAFAHQ